MMLAVKIERAHEIITIYATITNMTEVAALLTARLEEVMLYVTFKARMTLSGEKFVQTIFRRPILFVLNDRRALHLIFNDIWKNYFHHRSFLENR